MKTINVAFEDKEYDLLIKAKGELSWRDFIIESAAKYLADKEGR